MADFAPILAQTFTFEGGYDANPVDKGNYNSLGQLVGTNRGISAPVYESYIKRPPLVADMKAITKEIASSIYKKKFWDILPGDPFTSQSVAHIIFDGYVNSGVNMFKVARKAVNDLAGSQLIPFNNKPFTPDEIQKINSLDAEKLFDKLKQGRIDYYNNLVKAKPEDQIYLKGWLNRVNAFYFDDVLEVITATTLAPVLDIADIITNPKRKRAKKILIASGAGLLLLTFGLIYHHKHKRA